MASALCADVLKAADLFKPPPSSPIYSTACNLAQQAAAGIRAYNFTGLLDHDAKVSGAAFQSDRGLRHLHDQRQSHSHLRRRRPSPCEAGCLRRAASVEPLRQLPAANHVSSSAAASSAIRRSMDTRGSSSPRSSTLPWCSRHAAHRTRAVRPAGFWHRMRQASSSHPASAMSARDAGPTARSSRRAVSSRAKTSAAPSPFHYSNSAVEGRDLSSRQTQYVVKDLGDWETLLGRSRRARLGNGADHAQDYTDDCVRSRVDRTGVGSEGRD